VDDHVVAGLLSTRRPPTNLWAVALAIVFVGLAVAGATREPPVRRPLPDAPVAPHQVISQDAELGVAYHPRAVNVSARDLRLPRAPRHRSERPTSSLVDLKALTRATILEIIDDGGRHSVLIESPSGCPLAGHPLSLLRPPSLLAG